MSGQCVLFDIGHAAHDRQFHDRVLDRLLLYFSTFLEREVCDGCEGAAPSWHGFPKRRTAVDGAKRDDVGVCRDETGGIEGDHGLWLVAVCSRAEETLEPILR